MFHARLCLSPMCLHGYRLTCLLLLLLFLFSFEEKFEDLKDTNCDKRSNFCQPLKCSTVYATDRRTAFIKKRTGFLNLRTALNKLTHSVSTIISHAFNVQLMKNWRTAFVKLTHSFYQRDAQLLSSLRTAFVELVTYLTQFIGHANFFLILYCNMCINKSVNLPTTIHLQP